jgi:superfamily II DNA/RNA helicase
LHAELEKICRILDITVDLAHDRGKMLQQRNDIFDGTEIIIANPKRLYELYIQNGFNVSQLKLFILDDAIEHFKDGYKMQLSRIVESLPKCQHLYFSNTFNDKRIEEFLEEFIPMIHKIKA